MVEVKTMPAVGVSLPLLETSSVVYTVQRIFSSSHQCLLSLSDLLLSNGRCDSPSVRGSTVPCCFVIAQSNRRFGLPAVSRNATERVAVYFWAETCLRLHINHCEVRAAKGLKGEKNVDPTVALLYRCVSAKCLLS